MFPIPSVLSPHLNPSKCFTSHVFSIPSVLTSGCNPKLPTSSIQAWSGPRSPLFRAKHGPNPPRDPGRPIGLSAPARKRHDGTPASPRMLSLAAHASIAFQPSPHTHLTKENQACCHTSPDKPGSQARLAPLDAQPRQLSIPPNGGRIWGNARKTNASSPLSGSCCSRRLRAAAHPRPPPTLCALLQRQQRTRSPRITPQPEAHFKLLPDADRALHASS